MCYIMLFHMFLCGGWWCAPALILGLKKNFEACKEDGGGGGVALQ